MRPSWRRPVGGLSKLGGRKYCFIEAAICYRFMEILNFMWFLNGFIGFCYGVFGA